MFNVAAGQKDSDAANYGRIKNAESHDTNSTGQRGGTISLAGPRGGTVRISNLADGIADSDATIVIQARTAEHAAKLY